MHQEFSAITEHHPRVSLSSGPTLVGWRWHRLEHLLAAILLSSKSFTAPSSQTILLRTILLTNATSKIHLFRRILCIKVLCPSEGVLSRSFILLALEVKDFGGGELDATLCNSNCFSMHSSRFTNQWVATLWRNKLVKLLLHLAVAVETVSLYFLM